MKLIENILLAIKKLYICHLPLLHDVTPLTILLTSFRSSGTFHVYSFFLTRLTFLVSIFYVYFRLSLHLLKAPGFLPIMLELWRQRWESWKFLDAIFKWKHISKWSLKIFSACFLAADVTIPTWSARSQKSETIR